MDYPLNMMKPAEGATPTGFALASDEAEHATLSAAGFLPKLERAETPKPKKTKAAEPEA